MGNKKWETGKWGNGTATPGTSTQVRDSRVYMLCKVVQVLPRGGRPRLDPFGEKSKKNNMQ